MNAPLSSSPSPLMLPGGLPLMHVDKLSLVVEERHVLNTISFTLYEGQHLSIIGPNGAGKSTLLRCLLGLIAPQRHHAGHAFMAHLRQFFHLRHLPFPHKVPPALCTRENTPPPAHGWTGRITVQGRDLATLTPLELARIMAYVPQNNTDIPPFTVYDFAMLARYAHSHIHTNAKAFQPARTHAPHTAVVDSALKQTQLWSLRHRSLATLSGGERQKAYLAAALAQEPALLLLDEPAAFLDPAHDEAIHTLLRELQHTRKLTIITVSHDLNRVLLTNGPVLTLRKGLAQYFDHPTQLTTTNALNNLFDTHFLTVPHPQTQTPVLVPNLLAQTGEQA